MTFKDYSDAVGAISACNGCCSPVTKRQGGYTFRFDRLTFDNVPKRVEWTCPFKQILFDLDGTLTGIVNGTATPYYKFNEYAGVCDRQTKLYDDGIICDNTVRVRRLQIKGVSAGGSIPGFLDDKRIELRQSKRRFESKPLVYTGTDDLIQVGNTNHTNQEITAMFANNGEDVETLHGGGLDWDRFGANLDEGGNLIMFSGNCINERGYDAGGGCIEWESGHDYINFRDRDYYGWAIPLVTHADYYVDFDYTTDWQRMDVRWSEPFYIQTYATYDLESVMLRWPYIDYRYKYNISYPKKDSPQLPWFPGTRRVDETTSVRYSTATGNDLTGPIDASGVDRTYDWGVSGVPKG